MVNISVDYFFGELHERIPTGPRKASIDVVVLDAIYE
jgi:hypothetical protein